MHVYTDVYIQCTTLLWYSCKYSYVGVFCESDIHQHGNLPYCAFWGSCSNTHLAAQNLVSQSGHQLEADLAAELELTTQHSVYINQSGNQSASTHSWAPAWAAPMGMRQAQPCLALNHRADKRSSLPTAHFF